MSKVFFSTDKARANNLSLGVKAGKLKRVCRGIYTSDLNTPIEEIIQKNWMEVVAYKVPEGILSYRTALDCRLYPYDSDNSIVFMTAEYSKTINLPGLIIKINLGDNENFIERIHPDLSRTNQPRTLLENLSNTRGLKGVKTVDRENIEIQIAKILHNRGESGLNALREEARDIAEKLNLSSEFKVLNIIISSLLSTNSDSILTSKYAKSLLKKEPFDAHRINLFMNLSAYLQHCDFVERNYLYDRASFKNLSFFESYFSNYIEGTKFILDEAEDIIFSGKTINSRHQDSHDVLANFMISDDYLEISKTPNNPREFIDLLQYRHSILMEGRLDVSPGNFKNIDNRASNTFFVRSHDVVGTLTQAFEIYASLKKGMHRALFMHFVVSEVHPFIDGNGRMSRIMLNSELVKDQKYKIIIPNVYRDSYMSALRAVTRDEYFFAYCKMMDIAQAYTAHVPWHNYIEARNTIEKDYAERSEDEGLPLFNRVIQKLKLTEFPNPY